MVAQFWVRSPAGIRGPLPLDRIREEALNGILKADQEVSTDQVEWIPAVEIEGLEFPQEPPARKTQAW